MKRFRRTRPSVSGPGSSGAVGPAVLPGHVHSSEHGSGIAFDFGALQPGDKVTVTRADGTVAIFAVDWVQRQAKDELPTIDVYGNTDEENWPLLACGGGFDSGVRPY